MTLENLYLILPGLLGNLGAWTFGKINSFNYPIDFNIKFKGKRLFGKNKTFKGVLASIAIASIVNFSLNSNAGLGAMMGFSVAFGDTLKSFFKRRLNIKEGKDWLPYDLFDLPIGYSLFIFPILKIKLLDIIICTTFAILITLLAQLVGKSLNIKK